MIWEHATLPKSWRRELKTGTTLLRKARKARCFETVWHKPVFGLWNNAVCFWQRYQPTRVCTAHIDWTVCCKFHLLMEYSCITFIWGLFKELTIKRAVFIAWPFCDMRRRHSSKVTKERAENRNDSASKSAQGEVLWDHLTQACFWLVKQCSLLLAEIPTDQSLHCSYRLDRLLQVSFAYGVFMHHFHLRPIQGIDNKTCSIHSLTFLWYEKTPLFQGFQRESFKQERLCFEKRARRGALRPFDTSLLLISETMQFASGRDTNRPEFALLTSTGPFAVSFICLWSIRASLSSEAYSRNLGPAFAGFAPADFTATWSVGRVGIPSVTLTPAAPCSLTFVVGLLEWGSISDYNKLSNFILVSVQGHPRICLDRTTCCQMLALVADLEVIVKNKVLFWSPLPWPVLLENLLQARLFAWICTCWLQSYTFYQPQEWSGALHSASGNSWNITVIMSLELHATSPNENLTILTGI